MLAVSPFHSMARHCAVGSAGGAWEVFSRRRYDARRGDLRQGVQGADMSAPRNYEDLIRIIHERFEEMSKSYQRIAVYLTQNPNDAAVMSVNAIADRCGVHGSGFVRFAQSLGYTGFKELQQVLQKRLATAAPGFEARVRALEDELGNKQDGGPATFLRDLGLRDIASLQHLMENTPAELINRAVEMLATADCIYLIGQLRSAPIVELLRYILTMLGKRAILLDASGGLVTHMAKLIRD